MSWHFSRALVEEYSGDASLDGEQSAPSNTTPTPAAFFWPDKTTEHSRLSRFGMTSEPLTVGRGEAMLTSFRAASLARTSVRPAKVLALTGSEVDCGEKWQGSFARYSPATSTWKTAQCSLLGGLDEFSETWPRWGSMLNGVSYLRPTPELRTLESESGLWPTPVAQPANGTPHQFLERKRKCVARGIAMGVSLSDLQLVAVAKERGMHATGHLNPRWTEWLMGWPLGWTELKPLEMGKFQEWLKLHGKCSPLLNSRPPDPGGNLPSE